MKKPAIKQKSPTMTEGGSRRFEFRGGGSEKFWELTHAATNVTVRFGRIGTNGQTQTKSFADEAAAKNHADKLVAEMTSKGYSEVS